MRSGLLTSVHAFASDPDRGVFILTFLFFISAGALLLYAMRYEKLVPILVKAIQELEARVATLEGE